MAKLKNLQKLQELAAQHSKLSAEAEQWKRATKFHEDAYSICLTNEEKEYRNGINQPPRIYIETENINFSTMREEAIKKLTGAISEIEKEVETL